MGASGGKRGAGGGGVNGENMGEMGNMEKLKGEWLGKRNGNFGKSHDASFPHFPDVSPFSPTESGRPLPPPALGAPWGQRCSL